MSQDERSSFEKSTNSNPCSFESQVTLFHLAFSRTAITYSFLLQYSCEAVKYDRRGYKPRERALLASDKALYVLDASSRKTYKLKHRLPLDKLRVVVTNETDTLVLIKIPQELKKDKVSYIK